VPPRDIEGLATAICQLAMDRPRCAAMGLAARRRVEAEFSLERQVATFEDMYQSVARSAP